MSRALVEKKKKSIIIILAECILKPLLPRLALSRRKTPRAVGVRGRNFLFLWINGEPPSFPTGGEIHCVHLLHQGLLG